MLPTEVSPLWATAMMLLPLGSSSENGKPNTLLSLMLSLGRKRVALLMRMAAWCFVRLRITIV